MARKTICVLGGNGFVGSHLISRLVREHYNVRVLVRRRDRCRNLLVLPKVDFVETDIHDGYLLQQQIKGCDAVINLVAILNERRRGDFEKVHIALPRKILLACRNTGVSRLLHMSALNADADEGPSNYLRSKGQGEKLMHANRDLAVTSFRPSIIFGPRDHFFNQFAKLLKLSPVLPLACPRAKFAPVYVGDVVEHLIFALNSSKTIGQRLELCGPRSYTLLELVKYTNRILGLNRTVIGLNNTMSRLFASVMQYFPGKPFTPDNYLSLQKDNICWDKTKLPSGKELTPLEAIVPFYISRRGQQLRYDEIRRNIDD